MCKVQDCLRTHAFKDSSFFSLRSGHTFSFAAAKRYFLGSTWRICNLFSLLPFEKLLFNVCCVRCTSGSAADVRASWPRAGAVLEFPRLALCRNGASRLLREREISLAARWRGKLNKPCFVGPEVLTSSAVLKGPIHESRQLRAVGSGLVLAGFSLQMLMGSIFLQVQGGFVAPGKGSRYFAKSLTVVPCLAGMKPVFPWAVAVALGRMFGGS